MDVSRYQLSPDAITQEVAGEMVILDLGSEVYFSLDEVGTRIWQMLASGRSIPEIMESLLEEYDVSAAELEADVLALLASLDEAGLVSPLEDA